MASKEMVGSCSQTLDPCKLHVSLHTPMFPRLPCQLFMFLQPLGDAYTLPTYLSSANKSISLHTMEVDKAEAMDVDGKCEQSIDTTAVTNETPQTSSNAPVVDKKKQRFEVKKWTAVAFWLWDIQVENCAICRNHLMEPCIECQPNTINNSQDKCIAAWGACNHAFHYHCINRWLQQRPHCPLDNTEWTYQKLGN